MILLSKAGFRHVENRVFDSVAVLYCLRQRAQRHVCSNRFGVLLPKLRDNLFPGVQHLWIECNDAVAGHFGRWRQELSETIVDKAA